MLGGAFGSHRSRLILIVTVAVVVLVALATVAVMAQRAQHDGQASTHKTTAGERQADEQQANKPPSSLGIDLVHCPKSEPEKLPPAALADATEDALDQLPSVKGYVLAYVDGEAQTARGTYASSAYLTRGGSASRPGVIKGMCRERPQYAQLLLDRSVEVNMQSPEVESASLSQHSVYVAKFEGDYWVYSIGH